MSKFTFSQCAESVIREYTGIWNGATYDVNVRALRRVSSTVTYLHSHGKISHLDPHDIDIHDVKAFVIHLKNDRKLSPASIDKELSFFQKVLLSCENDSVRFAREKWPYLVPKASKGRGSVLLQDQIDSIIDEVSSMEVQDRSEAMPSIVALATGARTNEFRNMKVDDIDLSSRIAVIMVPKGMVSYGQKRKVPIRPEFFSLISDWNSFIGSGYLCPNMMTGGMLSINALEEDRRHLCDRVGFYFDYRMCRSTYGQMMRDEGIPIDVVSVLLGHSSSRTTENYYARVRNVSALEMVLSSWYDECESVQDEASKRVSQHSKRIGEQEGIRTLGLQLRRLPPYPS